MDPCVKAILCGLSGSVLGALNAIIDAQKATILAAVAAAESELSIVRIANAPIAIAAEVAQTIVDEAHAAADLVPLQLLAGCGDLGELNLAVNTALDGALADVNSVLTKANRWLSFEGELNERIAELNASLESFADFQLVIASCTRRAA